MWIALISLTGRIIWKEEYKYKRQSFASTLAVHDRSIYLLHESNGTLIFQTKPNTIKKYRFFETKEKHDLYLLKVDSKGRKRWRRTIDKRRNVQVYGNQLTVSNQTIFLSYFQTGPELNPDDRTYTNSHKIATLDTKGRIEKISNFNYKTIIKASKDVVSCTTAADDTLNFFFNDSLVSTFIVPEEINHFWIQGSIISDGEIVLYGSHSRNLGLLIISFDHDYKLNWYWIKNGDSKVEPGGYVKNRDGSFSVAAEKWEKTEEGYKKWIYFCGLNTQCNQESQTTNHP